MKNLMLASLTEFLKNSWYFIVAGMLLVALIVFWIVEVKKSNKNKKFKFENLEEDFAEKEQTEPEQAKEEKEEQVQEVKEEPKKENTEEKKEEKPKAKKQTKEQPKEEVKEETKEEPKKETKKSAPKKAEKVEEVKVAIEVKEEKTEEETANKPKKAKYNLFYDKEKKDWVIKKSGSERATKRCRTKKEALEVIERLDRNNDINISVKKKDGKFQKVNTVLKKAKKED